MNRRESSDARWFVYSASLVMVTSVLAMVLMLLSPVPRTLARDMLGRATPGPALHTRVLVAAPGMVPGPLDGEPTPRADAERRPIAVTIDNYYPDARPQTGLGDASLVFETLVEGGFTRLMAVYLEHDPSVVGPVRSTRIYFDDWAAAYHAILAHVGGNDDADAELWQMRSVYNLDEGAAPFMLTDSNPYFWRSASRAVPDNMYANIVTLRAYAAGHGQNWHYDNAKLAHKQPAPPSARGRPSTLTIKFVDPLFPTVPANPDYQVEYRFDPATDSYRRLVGGTPQTDAVTHRAVRAQNVVVMHIGAGVPDAAAGTTVDAVSLPVIGFGSADYYCDGRVEHGAWKQTDALAPLQFLDRHGRPVQFNPGQTWIEVLPTYSTATWAGH